MDWKRDLVERLRKSVPGGYRAAGPEASEPTALAGIALCAVGELDHAQRAGNWLAAIQSDDGSVGVSAAQPTPCWPTSLAILMWKAFGEGNNADDYQSNIQHAIAWALADRGRPNKRQPHVGHDTTLVGWSWAADTHSWIEPTAMFVLALKAVGLSQHERTREAVRLLVDRLLPAGGCNYGNTIVLGQTLLAHVQPTGLAMMGLAGEDNGDSRIAFSLDYLERKLASEPTTASLCYGLLGLAAHNRRPAEADSWLSAVYERVVSQEVSLYTLALLALATADEYPLSPDQDRALAGLSEKAWNQP
ncbi:MAG: hypothetical protein L0Z07_02310 [Planctomycetes bacterium]|nr:hypothetical protein [Planctomycetota bacterium]